MIVASPRTNGVGRHDNMKAPAGQVQRRLQDADVSFHPDQNDLIAAIVRVRSDLRVNGEMPTESVRSAKSCFFESISSSRMIRETGDRGAQPFRILFRNERWY